MSNRQQESDLYNYFDKKEDNGSSQEDLYFQSQTSENMSLEENSDHDETPNAVKSYETHKLTIKNELTQKQRTNYTSIGNGFSVSIIIADVCNVLISVKLKDVSDVGTGLSLS